MAKIDARMESSRDIIIQVEDLMAARAFYEGLLGFVVFMDKPHMIGLETGALRLFVEKAPAFGPVLDFLVEDVQASKARLTAAGCSLAQEDASVPRVYLTDPFGLTFNLGKR